MFFKAIERHLTYKCDQTVWSSLSEFGFDWLKIPFASLELSALCKINPESPYIVIFSHGNASNISRLDFIYKFFNATNLSYIAYDYPGYGKTPGKPNEQGLYASLETIYNYVINNLGFKSEQIIFHGISLGGAVTIDVASRFPARACIIESSFTSSHAMGKKMFPRLQLQRLVPLRFNSIVKINRIKCPKLFVHGTDDQVIPFHMGQELFAEATEPKFFYPLEGAEHTNQIEVGGVEYQKTYQRFVETLRL
jgi:fermentation-respiration switch protein FrsA (DUF1100 family)